MIDIIEKAKQLFYNKINDYGKDPFRLLPHLPEAEKWVKYLLKKYPEADEDMVMLALWLHDIGHYPLPAKIDHAIKGEKIARDFLEKEGVDKNKIEKVLHCIRAHRVKDVIPETLEAKIIAFCDSASHLTDSMYFDIAVNDKNDKIAFRVYDKMERDWRDLDFFPEIKEELSELFQAWKKLLKAYEKIEI